MEAAIGISIAIGLLLVFVALCSLTHTIKVGFERLGGQTASEVQESVATISMEEWRKKGQERARTVAAPVPFAIYRGTTDEGQ